MSTLVRLRPVPTLIISLAQTLPETMFPLIPDCSPFPSVRPSLSMDGQGCAEMRAHWRCVALSRAEEVDTSLAECVGVIAIWGR